MASPEDHKHIATVLLPELLDSFNKWGREYRQDRDLGILGEFVGLYRKARKLKTLLWDRRDGDPPPEAAGWREGPREIMMEVVAHGLLMLVDWDRNHPDDVPLRLGEEKVQARAILFDPDVMEEESDKDGCPICGSPDPRMHPAIGGGGEVTSICQHPFHRSDQDADAPNYEADSEEEPSDYSKCGRCNPERGHTLGHRCDKRKTKRKQRTGTVVMDDGGPFLEDNEEEREEAEEEYCPTCASHMKATRLVISHGTKCGDDWHQVDVADRLGGV